MSTPRIVDLRSADPQATVTPGSQLESGDAVTPDLRPDGEEPSRLLEEGLIASTLHLVRQAGIVLVVQIVGAGLSYGLQVLLARLLHASDYGIYTYVFVWVSFVALLAGLGYPAASIRFLPVYRVKDDWPRIHGFMRTAFRMTFATAIGVAVCGVIGVEALHAFGAVGSPSAVMLGALLVPALAGSLLYTEIARAGNRVEIAFIPALIGRPVLIAIGAAAFFVLDGTLGSSAALIATLVAAYVVLAVQYALTRHLFDGPQTGTKPVVELREWFGVGITLLTVSAFVTTLLQVDIVIVGALRGTRDAGIYAAASKTATLVAFVIVAINAAAAPQFASLWSLGRVEELQRLVSKLAGLIFWPSLAIAIGLAVLSGPILDLFGPEFSVARPALLILLVGQIINAAAGSVGYLLTLTGYHREAARALGFSALACILLTVAGVWAFGLVGAALGTTTGFLLWNGALYWLVVRRLNIYPSIFTTLPMPRRRTRD